MDFVSLQNTSSSGYLWLYLNGLEGSVIAIKQMKSDEFLEFTPTPEVASKFIPSR